MEQLRPPASAVIYISFLPNLKFYLPSAFGYFSALVLLNYRHVQVSCYHYFPLLTV